MFDETLQLEFIGGSHDGAVLKAQVAPEYIEVMVNREIMEVYERQTPRPPFIYVKAGYAPRESWTGR